MAFFGSLGPPIQFWPFGPILDHLDPIFGPMQYPDFSCNIHTQGLKLSGKVVLFDPVGPST